MFTVKALLSTMLFVTIPALANCQNETVCDAFGRRCHSQMVCNSTYESPSYGQAPQPSNELPGIQPVHDYSASKPLGTHNCHLQNVNGHWENLCE